MSIFYQGVEVHDALKKLEIVPPQAKTIIVKFNFGSWCSGKSPEEPIEIEHGLGTAPNLVSIMSTKWPDEFEYVDVPDNAVAHILLVDASFRDGGTPVQGSYVRYHFSDGVIRAGVTDQLISVDNEKITLKSTSITYYFSPNVDYYLVCTRFEPV